MQMTETGLTDYWRKKYWPSRNKCTDSNKQQEARSLNLDDLQSAFLVLAVGISISAITFLFELMVFKLKDTRDD
jgi:hypothetical protein